MSGFPENGITGEGFKYQSVSLDRTDIPCIRCV